RKTSMSQLPYIYLVCFFPVGDPPSSPFPGRFVFTRQRSLFLLPYASPGRTRGNAPSALRGTFKELGFLPVSIHFLQRHFMELPPVEPRLILEVSESADKFLIGPFKRRFRVD